MLFSYSTDTFAVIEEDLVHSGDDFGALRLLHRHFCSQRRGFGPLRRRLRSSSVTPQKLLQSSKGICSTPETTLVLFGYSTDTFSVIEEDLVQSGDHLGALCLLQRHFCRRRKGLHPLRIPLRCSPVTQQTLLQSPGRICSTPETMSVLFGYSTDTFSVIEEDLFHSADRFGVLRLLHRHFCSHRRGFGPLQRRLWCSSVTL